MDVGRGKDRERGIKEEGREEGVREGCKGT